MFQIQRVSLSAWTVGLDFQPHWSTSRCLMWRSSLWNPTWIQHERWLMYINSRIKPKITKLIVCTYRFSDWNLTITGILILPPKSCSWIWIFYILNTACINTNTKDTSIFMLSYTIQHVSKTKHYGRYCTSYATIQYICHSFQNDIILRRFFFVWIKIKNWKEIHKPFTVLPLFLEVPL